MQSSDLEATGGPFHLALIMDGNGRWASRRGLPRTAGHRRGARGLRDLLERAAELGVSIVTLYAFSSDNWRRPREEVDGLMTLFASYLDGEAERCRRRGMRLQIIGRRDRLPAPLVASIRRAERRTRRQRRLLVRVAIDYSSRWAIGQAARWTADGPDAGPRFRRALARATHGEPVCDPDLIIRTGGEQRLSDFLLWESAYAELAFSPALFPDFTPDELASLVADFRRRQRRFGGLPSTASSSSVAQSALETGRAGADPGQVLAGSGQPG